MNGPAFLWDFSAWQEGGMLELTSAGTQSRSASQLSTFEIRMYRPEAEVSVTFIAYVLTIHFFQLRPLSQMFQHRLKWCHYLEPRCSRTYISVRDIHSQP